jgi:hypothetical protein
MRRMHFACWVTKATDTRSKYVTLTAFPRQQWLCERAPMLHYAAIAWLAKLILAIFKSRDSVARETEAPCCHLWQGQESSVF